MIKKKLVVANGNYTDKSGEEKTEWVDIGHLHEHNGKEYITLKAHVNLAGLFRKEGENRIFANLFDPKPRKGEFDDDIPF